MTPKNPDNLLRMGYPPADRVEIQQLYRQSLSKWTQRNFCLGLNITSRVLEQWQRNLYAFARKPSSVKDPQGQPKPYWKLTPGDKTSFLFDDAGLISTISELPMFGGYFIPSSEGRLGRIVTERDEADEEDVERYEPSDDVKRAFLRALVEDVMRKVREDPALQRVATQGDKKRKTGANPSLKRTATVEASSRKKANKATIKLADSTLFVTEVDIADKTVAELPEEGLLPSHFKDLLSNSMANSSLQNGIKPANLDFEKLKAAVESTYGGGGQILHFNAEEEYEEVDSQEGFQAVVEDLLETSKLLGKAQFVLRYCFEVEE